MRSRRYEAGRERVAAFRKGRPQGRPLRRRRKICLSTTHWGRNLSGSGAVVSAARFDREAGMMGLGVFCVAAGTGLVAASLWAPRYRALLERMGGCLFLAGLGFAGADLALAS